MWDIVAIPLCYIVVTGGQLCLNHWGSLCIGITNIYLAMVYVYILLIKGYGNKRHKFEYNRGAIENN